MRSLAHFGLGHHDGYCIVGGHFDPTVERNLPGPHRERFAREQPLPRRREGPADQQRARGADAGQQEIAALDFSHE